ncbi:heme-binding protein [Marinobacter sp. 1_MG-2023]|uniref:SOUL family heme-binding protein n=1 Tax=Marinobacter sp. 1_MG-2023 TaxID=3062627 RepID=UPI0026E202D4|nr:heme-binding protein [Marinobacter sp. 1_MG-2023]MDO6824995.1 heme-binding protein [Marinobacter sp. 1_MG-2023]
MLKRQAALVIALCSMFLSATTMATEEAEYTVLLKEDNLEVRQYEPQIVAETVVDTEFEDAGSEAFGRLFKYISGNNQSQAEIAMTAPVGQVAESQKIDMTAPVGQTQVDGQWVVSFMMPGSFTMDSIPKPNDERIALRSVPEQTMAAIRYSGLWSESGYQKNKSRLERWIGEKGYIATGAPVWARYNAPFIPWFLRRNEVLIPVEQVQ